MKHDLNVEMRESMDALQFSQEDKNAMIYNLNALVKEAQPREYNSRKLISAALAAVILVAMLTGAAIFTRWTRTAQNRYHPSQDIKELAEKSGLSVMLRETTGAENPVEVLSVTDQGITVTAEQTIVDKYSAMIVLRIDGFELPKGEKPSLTIFSAEIADVHTVIPPGRFYDGISAGTSGKHIYSDGSPVLYDADGQIVPRYADSDGSLEYYAIFSFSKGNVPVEKEIKMQITAIGTETTPSMVRGNWELCWTLSGTSETLNYQLKERIGNTDVTLLEVEISPISIFAAYKLNNADGHIHHNDPSSNAGRGEAYEKIEFLMTGIRMRDGTVYHFGAATGINTMYSDAGVALDYPEYHQEILNDQAVLLTKSRLIGQIVDPAEIDALIFQKSLPVQTDIAQMDDEDFCILSLP